MEQVTRSEQPDRMMLQCGMEIFLRDLEAEDGVLYPEFHEHVSADDRRLRFFSATPISQRQIHRLTHFNPADAVARAAIGADGKLYGVSRLHRMEGDMGEFGVMVRSDVKGQGLGRRLLEEVIERAPELGITRIIGLILPDNHGMLALASELGFEVKPDAEEAGVMRASLDLIPPSRRWAA